MENLQKWLEESNVQIVLGVLGTIGWFVGIISGWLQWKGYRDQKKIEGAYQTIFEQAQRDWQGRYTEEQVKELSAQFNRLEGQIRREIPKESRIVFLKDQRYSLMVSVGESYKKYVEVNNELKTLGVANTFDESDVTTTNLDNEISTAIENYILPQYLEQERKNKFITKLIVAIFIASILPYFPSFFFGEVVLGLQLLFGIYVINLLVEYLPYSNIPALFKKIFPSRLRSSKRNSSKINSNKKQ